MEVILLALLTWVVIPVAVLAILLNLDKGEDNE